MDHWFLHIRTEKQKNWCYTIIYSLFDEINGPIVEQGAILIKYQEEKFLEIIFTEKHMNMIQAWILNI